MDKENKIRVLTEQELKTARTYVPTTEKDAFVSYAATRCFDRLELTTEEGDPVPPMWKENAGRKARYMIAGLVWLYLMPEEEVAEDGSDWELSDVVYDALASSQLVNQIERIKKRTGDQTLRDKLYDLLADYHFLEKMLNAECYGLLQAMNDPVSRFQSLMSSSVTPDVLEEIQKQAESTKKEIASYLIGQGTPK